MKYFVSSLFCFLVSIQVQADILFLDVNNSPAEIAAAKKAAKSRGENLIVLPSAGTVGQDVLNKKTLDQKLAELNRSNTKLSSVIISGHDGNGYFTGNFGNISASDVGKSFADNPQVADGIKGLFLWGCYTSTPGSIDMNWKKTFNNLDVIVGFDGIAPAGNKLAGQKYLEDALIKQKKMSEVKNEQELGQIFKKLQFTNTVNASICSKDFYVSKSVVSTISKLKEMCNPIEEAKLREVFDCYNESKPTCESVPQNTAQSPLRDYYNHLQTTSHCDELYRVSYIFRPTRDQVIKLIFHKNVVANFQKNAGVCLDTINSVLKASNAPDSLYLNDMTKLSRSELRKKSSELSQYLYSQEASQYQVREKFGVDVSKDVVLQSAKYTEANNCSIGIVGLNSLSDDIPFSWVEPNANTPMNSGIVASLAANENFIYRMIASKYLRNYGNQKIKINPKLVLEYETAREKMSERLSSVTESYFEEARQKLITYVKNNNKAELDLARANIIGGLPKNTNPEVKKLILESTQGDYFIERLLTPMNPSSGR